MTRNLKVLGLALVAMMAMSAVVASSASAVANPTVTAINANQYPLTLSGQSPSHEFTAPSGVVKCKVSTFHSTVTAASSSITVTPKYHDAAVTDCTAAGNPATIVETDCDFVIHSPATINGHYKATTDVVCPTGTGIHVEVFAGHGHGFRICKITVPPQKNLEGMTITNKGVNNTTDIELEGTVVGIHETQTGLCGSSSGVASYHIAPTTVTEANGKAFHIG